MFFRTLLLDNKLPQNIVASPVAQMVKKLTAMQKTHVRSLGREDPLEKGMATHSSILAWRIPRDRRAGYSPWGREELDMTEPLNTAQTGDYSMKLIES